MGSPTRSAFDQGKHTCAHTQQADAKEQTQQRVAGHQRPDIAGQSGDRVHACQYGIDTGRSLGIVLLSYEILMLQKSHKGMVAGVGLEPTSPG